MPITDITPVEGPLAGYRQGMLDIEKVQQAPLETELLRAHAGKATLDLQNQQKMMQLMSEYGAGQAKQGDTYADRMDYLGDLALKSGLPEQANKYLGTASLMRSRAATADASSTRAVLNRGAALVQDLATYERYMSGATDQASFDALNAAYFGVTGKVGILAGHQYTTEAISELTKQAMGAKDRLNAGMRGQENMSRDRLRERREAEMDSLDAYREWRKGFMERHEARLAKAGAGRAVTSPSKDEQVEAIRLIKKDYPELYSSSPEETQNAAFTISSRARELRRQNPALSSKEAIARAYTESNVAGDFKHTEARRFLGFQTGKAETRYLGEGKTAETAIRMPTSKDLMEKGTFYTWGTGQVGQWTGTGLSPVAIDPGDGSDDESGPEDEED
jgi:hypothetical protein